MKIKLTFFLPHLHPGGVERVVVNLLRHLDREQFQLSLILSKKEGAMLELLPGDVEVIDLQGVAMRKAIGSVAKCLRERKIDVAYGGTNAANLTLLAASRLIPNRPAVIASEHATPRLFLDEAKWRPLRITAMRLLYPRADAIAVPLEDIGHELQILLGAPQLPITVLPNPLVHLDGKISPRNHPPNAQSMFVAAGRLVSLKGFDILINAFARLVSVFPEVRLTILGEGPQRPQLEALIAQLGLQHLIQMPGNVADPMVYYRKAIAVVSASRWEGFGNVLVEAMACATPVIATDCPVGPRRILENGKAGLLVPPEDPDALAQAMSQLLKEPGLALQLSTKGIERAKDFTIKPAVLAFQQMVKTLQFSHRQPTRD